MLLAKKLPPGAEVVTSQIIAKWGEFVNIYDNFLVNSTPASCKFL
jgi:hypothetical protein